MDLWFQHPEVWSPGQILDGFSEIPESFESLDTDPTAQHGFFSGNAAELPELTLDDSLVGLLSGWDAPASCEQAGTGAPTNHSATGTATISPLAITVPPQSSQDQQAGCDSGGVIEGCGTPQPDKRLKARDSREERARQAQRRYRDRQKGKLEEYKQKVEQLTAQCAELMREKENVQSRYKLLEQATAAQRQQRGATPQQADQGGAASPELHRIVANFANLVYQGQQQQRQVNQAEVAQWGSDDYFRLHQDYVAQLALCLLQGAEVSGSVENKRLEALVLAMRAVVRAMDRPLHRSIMLKFKQYAADQSSPAPGDHWQQVLAATGLTALQKQEIHAAWLKLLADMSRILPQRWSILGILQTATQAESAMAVDQVHLQRFNATLQLHQQLHNSLKEESRAVHNFKTSFIVEAFTPIQEARCVLAAMPYIADMAFHLAAAIAKELQGPAVSQLPAAGPAPGACAGPLQSLLASGK